MALILYKNNIKQKCLLIDDSDAIRALILYKNNIKRFL